MDTGRPTATIVVGGDCDIAMESRVVPLLREACDAGVEQVELDFCGAEFADCSAVHVADAACQAVGTVSVRACARVGRIFELTRTTRRFQVSTCC